MLDGVLELDLGSEVVDELEQRGEFRALVPVKELPSAQRPYGKLRLTERRILGLHCQAVPNAEIARALSIPPSRVSRVINNPMSQDYLGRIYRDYEHELKALFPLVVRGLRMNLVSSDPKVRSSAMDLFAKFTGRYKDTATPDQTAEDVIRRIMEIHSEGPVTVRIGEVVSHGS